MHSLSCWSTSSASLPGGVSSPGYRPISPFRVDQGGRGFGVLSTTGLLLTLNLLGMFPGYLLFGPVADRLGRKGAFVLYLVAAALLVPLYSWRAAQPH